VTQRLKKWKEKGGASLHEPPRNGKVHDGTPDSHRKGADTSVKPEEKKKTLKERTEEIGGIAHKTRSERKEIGEAAMLGMQRN